MPENAPGQLSRASWLFPPLSDRTVTLASVGLILVGCALRLIWAFHGHLEPVNSEAFFIARSLAEGRGYADAFGPGTGPTAHLMPLTPLPAALVYAILGVGTRPAELTLAIWAFAVMGAALVLGERILRELGVPGLARVAAVAVAAILPLQFSLESVAFREWEGGLAAAGSLLIVLAVLRLDRAPAVSWRTLLGLGLGNGFLFLVSPAAAIGTSGVIGLFLLRKVSWKAWWLPIAAAICVVLAVVVPWGLRNEQVLGKFVPLRTGSGISLGLAYYDGRSDDAHVKENDARRFREVSPLMSSTARQRYLQVGEIAYNREVGAQASAWMAAHKPEVLKIRIRNFIQFYAPPAWFWTRFTTSDGSFVGVRRWFMLLSTLAAIITVGYALVRRRWQWLYIAAALLLPSLPYIAIYPILRYRYLISTLLTFIAVGGVAQLAASLTPRKTPGPEQV